MWWWWCKPEFCDIKDPAISPPPENQHAVFYRPDTLPATQPTVSKHRKHRQRQLETNQLILLLIDFRSTLQQPRKAVIYNKPAEVDVFDEQPITILQALNKNTVDPLKSTAVIQRLLQLKLCHDRADVTLISTDHVCTIHVRTCSIIIYTQHHIHSTWCMHDKLWNTTQHFVLLQGVLSVYI